MKWEMESDEIEAVLEKIWDLHDKLSDAIHSISRAHYLNSIKSLRKSDDVFLLRRKNLSPYNNNGDSAGDGKNRAGSVFVKEFPADDDDYYSAVQEAKSLNAIRSAFENLEDQLEFFHTIQVQQRAERDAAVARLEQSRIFLARRLAEHQGKKYKVIEEALAFVGGAGQFVSGDNLFPCPPVENFETQEGKRFNLTKVLINSFNFAKNSLKLNEMGGILSNAALVAFSMLALLHLHQAGPKEKYVLGLPQKQENALYNRNVGKQYQPEDSSSSFRLTHLDVTLARG